MNADLGIGGFADDKGYLARFSGHNAKYLHLLM
jgi:hypothetical protein